MIRWSDDRTEKDWVISHSMYAELLEHCSLRRLRPDGTIDDSQFVAWAMQRFGLRQFMKYRIIVEGK